MIQFVISIPRRCGIEITNWIMIWSLQLCCSWTSSVNTITSPTGATRLLGLCSVSIDDPTSLLRHNHESYTCTVDLVTFAQVFLNDVTCCRQRSDSMFVTQEERNSTYVRAFSVCQSVEKMSWTDSWPCCLFYRQSLILLLIFNFSFFARYYFAQSIWYITWHYTKTEELRCLPLSSVSDSEKNRFRCVWSGSEPVL